MANNIVVPPIIIEAGPHAGVWSGLIGHRLSVLEAGRQVLARDGLCPTCLGDLAEYRDLRGKVCCPRCLGVVYNTDGTVAGRLT